jgi:hypothetical protein
VGVGVELLLLLLLAHQHQLLLLGGAQGRALWVLVRALCAWQSALLFHWAQQCKWLAGMLGL